MPDVGMLNEQGFLTEDAGMGFKPVKEDSFNPFDNNSKPAAERDRGKAGKTE